MRLLLRLLSRRGLSARHARAVAKKYSPSCARKAGGGKVSLIRYLHKKFVETLTLGLTTRHRRKERRRGYTLLRRARAGVARIKISALRSSRSACSRVCRYSLLMHCHGVCRACTEIRRRKLNLVSSDEFGFSLSVFFYSFQSLKELLSD